MSDPDDVVSLSYTLNGGAPVTLSMGPLTISGLDRRLINDGDFIVDLLVADLQTGANSVVITAVDGIDDTSTETVTLDYTPGNSWPLNYDTDWGSLTVDGNDLTPDPAILEQAHVVDGQWTVIGDSIRTIDPGYDRLIGIGSMEWGDYEVEVPLTIHEILNPTEFGAGFILRWNGHTDDPHFNDQPKVGWNPLGDIGWLFGNQNHEGLQLWTSKNDSSFTIQENIVYWLKIKVETNGTGTKYSLKTWEEGQLEPDYPPATTDQRNDYGPLFGSLLLVAHNADVSFGNVHIVPIISPNDPPVAVADNVTPHFNGTSFFKILKNDYDLDGAIVTELVNITSSPTRGTITDINPVTGVVTYVHGGLDLIPDSFTYTIEDNDGAVSDPAIVTLTIVPNQPPVAGDDVFFAVNNLQTNIDVLVNDDDSDGFIIPGTVSVQTPPQNGLADVNPDGSITYTAMSAEPDSFTYTVDDESEDPSLPAMVRIAVGSIPPEDFHSDDFNSCEVDPLWQFIDPQGDAPHPVIEGAFSNDAQIAMSVPGGTAHEPYNGILGAPYLIQSALDKDFTLEAKFSSDLPDTSFAEQGILIIQDNQNWVRFDFFSKGADVNVFGVANDNSTIGPVNLGPISGPTYLRVLRTGDNWDLHYSTNGTFFPLAGSLYHPLTVTGVGLFVGNQKTTGGTPPPFTTFVDYFSNSVNSVTETDDQDLSIQLVTNVSGGGSVAANPDLVSYNCGDIVELTPAANPGWTFAGWSGDLTGMDNPASISMDRTRYVTANFTSASGTIVLANTSGVPGLSTTLSCATGVPVEILHESGTDIRDFTVTFALTDLELCDGLASITEGDYLSSVSATTFTPTLNGNGTYDVDVALTGTPCGATAMSGTLFTLDVTHSIANGTGTIDILDVQLRDCGGSPVAATAGGPSDIAIDTIVPAGVTNLVFNEVVSGNPAGNVTEVDLQWSDSTSGDAVSVSVYRKGFGSYPEYSDGGGSTPILPVDPLSEGWALVGSVPKNSETLTDLGPTRDYWHFCARAFDGVGNPSAVVMTGGVLNYLLGDVSDGGDPIVDGDNRVWVEDLTFLGAHYGTQEGDAEYVNTLDIGPTDDLTVTGLPTTDNMIEFEDLMLFGLNYTADVGAKSGIPVLETIPDPADHNLLALHLPDLPQVGETFQAALVLASDGRIQGLKMPLVWDAGIVEPIAVKGGALLTQQDGLSLTLSSSPGVVDVCLVGIRESGISGTGTVATVTFRVLAEGQPMIEFADVMARDQANQPITVMTSEASPVDDGLPLPTVSALHLNYPNPFNPTTTLAFDLAVSGRVKIDIYSIDGRLVKTLVNGVYAAGRHSEIWNGRDHAGRAVASGTYLYKMEGPRIKQTRRMLLIK